MTLLFHRKSTRWSLTTIFQHRRLRSLDITPTVIRNSEILTWAFSFMLDGNSAAVAEELTDIGLGAERHKHRAEGGLLSSENGRQSSPGLTVLLVLAAWR